MLMVFVCVVPTTVRVRSPALNPARTRTVSPTFRERVKAVCSGMTISSSAVGAVPALRSRPAKGLGAIGET